MAIRDIFKVSRKTFFNPRAWMNYDELREYTNTILVVLQGIFTKPTPVREETFEQAMGRMHINEKDIDSIASSYRVYALFFLFLGFCAFVYAFFVLFRHGTFIGWVLGIAVTALFLSQAFKYDFWSLQMRKRTLGLTFADWKDNLLGVKKGTSS